MYYLLKSTVFKSIELWKDSTEHPGKLEFCKTTSFDNDSCQLFRPPEPWENVVRDELGGVLAKSDSFDEIMILAALEAL